MIYLLYGSDQDKARAKLTDLVDKMVAKKPDATHVKVTEETATAISLDELIGGIGLFSSKLIVEADHVLKNKEAKEQFLDRLADIAASENIFIFIEDSLLKAEQKAFEKHAEKIQEFESTAEPAKKDNTFFTLADALGKRDKKQLWSLYIQALQKGSAPEELHGILFWQVKSMIIASQSKTAAEAKLNPFVFSKSKSFAQNFTAEELTGLSTKLVSLYHQARQGIGDMSTSLEQFILEV